MRTMLETASKSEQKPMLIMAARTATTATRTAMAATRTTMAEARTAMAEVRTTPTVTTTMALRTAMAAALLLFVMILPLFLKMGSGIDVYAAGPKITILPLAPSPTPTPGVVPQKTAPPPSATQSQSQKQPVTPRPAPTPTSDPMLQDYVRERVESVNITDIMPTPSVASKDVTLTVRGAVNKATDAAKPSIRNLEIAESNAMKQVASVRNAVNMAIRALNTDDRYLELVAYDEIWGGEKRASGRYILNPDGTIKGDLVEPEVRAELSVYQAMGYEELSRDDRLALEVTRDMGYDKFNINILSIEHNQEILKKSIEYSVYAQYAGIAKMQAALALQKSALEITQDSLDITKKRYELGYATRVEVDSTQAAYDKAVLELLRSERSLKSLVTSFNKTLGENLDTTYEDFDLVRMMPARADRNIKYYIERALNERSEVILAAERKRLAEKEAEYYMAVYTNEKTFERYEKIQAADEAGIDYELTLINVEAEVRDSYKQLLALKGSLPYNERQIELAKENLTTAEKMLELGVVTQSRVDAAALAVSQAELQLTNNKISIWSQQKQLDIICGIGPGNLR